ncbi:hypothetical protein ACLMJK_002294 [Lecanora helva]
MAASRQRTLYNILGLDRSASKSEVKDAYKKMALRYHPDKNSGNNTSVAMFQEIVEAYEVLYDDRRRTNYDAKVFNSRWFQTAYTQPVRPRRPPEWEDEPEDWSKPYIPPAEDWSRPYVPPAEDPWVSWARQDEEDRKAKEEQKAARRERRKKQQIHELTLRLSDILAEILKLDSGLDELEKECAEDALEEMNLPMDEDENESDSWDSIFQRNVVLNSLKKERDLEVSEWKRLYHQLQKLHPEKSKEAKEAYKALRKRASKNKRESESEEPHNAVEIRQEQQATASGLQDPSNDHTNHLNTEDEETPENYPNFDPDQPSDNADNAGDENDEIILYQMRQLHASHKEVQAEFWDIANADDICCYCGNTCAVMQCPRYEECGLSACEHCKSRKS